MVNVKQIKKYLPNDIEVKAIEKTINGDAEVFIVAFPNTHIIDGKEKRTTFAISFTGFDKKMFGDGENVPEELIKSRTEIAYQQGLKHESNIRNNHGNR